MTLSIDLAIQALKDGYSISVQGADLEVDAYWPALKKRWSEGFASQETLKVIEWIEKKLPFSGPEERPKLFLLSKYLIKKFSRLKPIQKELLRLDHRVGRHCGYNMKENERRLEKWQKYGFEPKIFERESDFVQFLFNSPLASQMKISRDTIEMAEGEPAILVEGKRTKFSDLHKRFTYKYSPIFKESFIYERQTNEVFTYLATGQGLVKHNPYLADPMTPIAKLSREEHAAILKSAKCFIRPGESEKENEKRGYVLQIVTNAMHDWSKEHPITGNFAALFRQAKHPFLRIINPQGDVAEVGFNWGNISVTQVLAADRGRFRSPDLWEYKSSDEQVTTNLPIDDREAQKFQDYVRQYHNEGVHFGRWPAYHLLHQNCTTFVPAAIQYATGIKIQNSITFPAALARIAPPLLQALGSAIKGAWLETKKIARRILPESIAALSSLLIQKIKKIWAAIIAFGLAVITFLLGNSRGEGGRRFGTLDKDLKLSPPLQSLRKWFDFSQYRFDAPALLQEWQRAQPSTTIAHKKVRLFF